MTTWPSTKELKFPVIQPNSRSVTRTKYPPFIKLKGVHGILRTISIMRDEFISVRAFMSGSRPVPLFGIAQTTRNNMLNNDDEKEQQRRIL
jgi:hypothetical protein